MQIGWHEIFLFLFCMSFFGAIWVPVSWILLSIFTPKTLLEKYFKEPHFTLAETILIAQFPGFLLRTAIFGWLLVLPKLDRKRKIKEVERYIPRWYAIALKLFTIITMTILFLFVFLMGLLFFMEPDTQLIMYIDQSIFDFLFLVLMVIAKKILSDPNYSIVMYAFGTGSFEDCHITFPFTRLSSGCSRNTTQPLMDTLINSINSLICIRPLTPYSDK